MTGLLLVGRNSQVSGKLDIGEFRNADYLRFANQMLRNLFEEPHETFSSRSTSDDLGQLG